MYLSDLVIILCRPSEPGNVGAVCRAMKNMGLTRLRLVAPAPGAKTSRDEAVLLARAVHAEQVWEDAETFDTLAAAVADLSLVIGTTRRRGHHRKAVTQTPEECAAFLKCHPGPAALVFGNERTGLEASELNLCNLASHIPVDDAFPSLNLSHAVQIYAYQLFRTLDPNPAPVAGTWRPLDRISQDALVKSISDSLAGLGFYKQRGREEQERFLRDVFARAGLTADEGRYLRNIFVKAARLSSS
ncbi:TrmJ/YjtD family RNA methyltransferase [Treponema primitia]|uniref:RNA methyltransferase n=1 Tax=Treponema primitia TaxID=88058 RepID=UPI0039803DAF